jgi:phenylalanyl-tRNA synthetase alpha chain
MKNIETIKDKYTSIIYNTNNLKDLDNVRISAVGKKGEISSMMQEIGKMSIDQKKQMGPLLNSLKNDIISQIDQKKNELETIAIDKALENESIDMSLPINLSEGTL